MMRRLAFGAALLAMVLGCGSGDTVDTSAEQSTSGVGGTTTSGVGGAGGDNCTTDELCDGLDNNCDGTVDEDCACIDGDTQDCFSGDPTLIGVGDCAEGLQTCSIDGAWGTCDGEVLPIAEVCDGNDNSCNGQVDDGFGQITCGLGICQNTVDECVDGQTVPCVPGQPNMGGETCDGTDDNCDGQVDEGCSCINGQMQSCYSGSPNTQNVGICMDGLQTCASGQWGSCVGDVTPQSELCDGLDNDCDMQTDENNPGGGGACNTNLLGVCAAGTDTCQNAQIVCLQNVQPSAEVCDGLDNDCDGQVDDGNPGGGGLCNTGQLGVCATGTFTCQNGSVVCVANTTPSAESCDGLDNDCDGMTDEGNPGGGGNCNTGNPGICAPGTNNCVGGNIVCTQNNMAGPEQCDGLDNDCDNAVDEGNPGGGGNCNTGNLGICAAGTNNCIGGSIVCSQNNSPSAEQCDSLDNDCDGMTDEGNPGGGNSCNSGQLGVCMAGTTACQSGSIVCNANQMASAEQCNSLDDDCDGMTDEGNPGGGMMCATGQLGVCSAGTTNCQSGSIVCNANNTPSAEVCDNLDNDCDGSVDEGNPGGGGSCNTGNPGICSAGTLTCQGGVIVCIQNNSAITEVCGDNLDNDCDGMTDEGCNDCTTNLALAATPTASGGGAGSYGPGNYNDGTTEAMCAAVCSANCFGWVANTSTPAGAWVQYTWTGVQSIGSMYVDANACSGICTGPGRTMFGGTVQWWNGSSWVTAQAFTGNDGDRAFNFSPALVTDRIRIFDIHAATCGQASNTEIYEWYVWPGNNCTP